MFKGIVTGLGGRGLHWLKQARQHGGCQIVACVEPLAANRERAIRDYNVAAASIFPSLDEAIAKAKADFVLDVTPPAVHQQIAAKSFAAGLHVLGEKPLSDSYGAARNMVALSQKHKCKHMITQNYRFGSSPRTIRQLVAQGLIGPVGQFDVRFYMNWADLPGSHYVTQPYMLINDMMVHHFDMIRYVLGSEPVAVQAITWNHPWGWHQGDAAHAIVFEFPGGTYVSHVSVGCAVGQNSSWNGDWRLEGPKGSLTLEAEVIRHVWRHRTPAAIDQVIAPVPAPPSEQAILDEFFAAITQDREPECSGRDNLHSLAMVFAAISSAKEKRRVALAELDQPAPARA